MALISRKPGKQESGEPVDPDTDTAGQVEVTIEGPDAERLEGDVAEIKGTLVHIAGILVSHGDRLDSMGNRLDSMQQSVVDRLDRLIEVTLQERTHSVARLGDFEQRLVRLEEHVGIPRE